MLGRGPAHPTHVASEVRRADGLGRGMLLIGIWLLRNALQSP